MLARIVEHWLTRANELGYQTAFTQLLSNEGYRVLHGPVHHPYEHGKDITAVSPEGFLHAFQLKGGRIGLPELDAIQGQLLALAGTTVSYPGVEPPRPPDRAFLVTNSQLTAPARDRLRSFNDSNRRLRTATIEVIESEQLVARFVAAHEQYLPSELRDLNAILRLVLADGRGPFPTREFADMLWGLVDPGEGDSSGRGIARALGAATLLTSYALGAWQRESDHVRVAEAWLVLSFTILRVAEAAALPSESWQASLGLATANLRQALSDLVDEAAEAEDLVIPDVVEGLIYPARAALVCGYAAALFLSERSLGQADELREKVRAVLVRESEFWSAPGEAGTPHLLMIATALEVLGEVELAAKVVFGWASSLAAANAPNSEEAAADPYHSMEEVLLHSLGGESDLEDEQFGGRAFTLHVAIEWLVRRDIRPLVAALWPNITKMHFTEFVPDEVEDLLAHYASSGVQRTWAPATPGSWADLKRDAGSFSPEELPGTLWKHLELLPYLPLVYPHRLTAVLARALDHLSTGRCRASTLDVSEGVE